MNDNDGADFVKSVPDSFWQSMAAINANDALLSDYLMKLGRDQYCEFFRVYLELRTEFAAEIMDRLDDVSEDTADDLGDAMVAAGKDKYLDAYFERGPLTDRDDWEDLPLLMHVFIGVYHDRFDSSILDDVELA